jgi:prevent-host-death family protein
MAISVGIRELRSSLSRYLKRVRAGETIEITDHGELIARIIPSAVPEDLARLMSEGKVRWSVRRFVAPQRPVKARKGAPLASQIISEDRR